MRREDLGGNPAARSRRLSISCTARGDMARSVSGLPRRCPARNRAARSWVRSSGCTLRGRPRSTRPSRDAPGPPGTSLLFSKTEATGGCRYPASPASGAGRWPRPGRRCRSGSPGPPGPEARTRLSVWMEARSWPAPVRRSPRACVPRRRDGAPPGPTERDSRRRRVWPPGRRRSGAAPRGPGSWWALCCGEFVQEPAGQAGRHLVELQSLVLAPGQKPAHLVGVGRPRVRVGDPRREELIGREAGRLAGAHENRREDPLELCFRRRIFGSESDFPIRHNR